VTILAGLLKGAYSLAPSHYCPTRELLAARFPSWPGSLLFRQPGPAGFLRLDHVDAGLSADTCSTQATIQQDSRPQASLSTKPPSSRITGMRHIPGEMTHSFELYKLDQGFVEPDLNILMCKLMYWANDYLHTNDWNIMTDWK